jgi:hypothetical protein
MDVIWMGLVFGMVKVVATAPRVSTSAMTALVVSLVLMVMMPRSPPMLDPYQVVESPSPSLPVVSVVVVHPGLSDVSV